MGSLGHAGFAQLSTESNVPYPALDVGNRWGGHLSGLMSLWLQIRSRRWLSRTSSLEGDDLRLHLLSVIRKMMFLGFIFWGWYGRWWSWASSFEGDDLKLYLLRVIRKMMILGFIFWVWSGKWWSWFHIFECDPKDDLWLHLLKVMILGFICWVWSGRWWSWLSSFYGDPEDDDLGIHLSMEIRRMIILGFIFRWYLEDDDLGLHPLRETQKMIILGFIFWGWSGRWWSWASSFWGWSRR